MLGLSFILLIWAVLSVFCQWDTRLSSWIRSYDFFGLIPRWSFFAPNPVSQDSYLYYRDHGHLGAGPWRRAFQGEVRHILDSFWNPLRREEKAISDAMFHVLNQSREVSSARLQISTSYLSVLSFVCSLPREDGFIARQFMFARQSPGQKPYPVFVSNIHSLVS